MTLLLRIRGSWVPTVVHRITRHAVVLPLVVQGCGSALDETLEIPADHAIQAVWENAGDALCKGDWARYEGLWASGADVELLHPAGPERLLGSEAILESYRELIASGFRCTYQTEWFDVQIGEAGDVAWVSTAGVLSGVDRDAWSQRTWYTLVFRRELGEWRLAHAHASAVPDPQ
jgi:uncharacterized protein (TIGR02246 family)